MKVLIFAIFEIAVIHEIDLKAIFLRIFKNPNGKILELWVKIPFARKKFPGNNRFYRDKFKIWSHDNIFCHAVMSDC